jgi:hypothetical protein
VEGGQANAPSLEGVPPGEHRVQGGTLNGFYTAAACQPFGNGQDYAVVPVPERFVPTFRLCH